MFSCFTTQSRGVCGDGECLDCTPVGEQCQIKPWLRSSAKTAWRTCRREFNKGFSPLRSGADSNRPNGISSWILDLCPWKIANFWSQDVTGWVNSKKCQRGSLQSWHILTWAHVKSIRCPVICARQVSPALVDLHPGPPTATSTSSRTPQTIWFVEIWFHVRLLSHAVWMISKVKCGHCTQMCCMWYQGLRRQRRFPRQESRCPMLQWLKQLPDSVLPAARGSFHWRWRVLQRQLCLHWHHRDKCPTHGVHRFFVLQSRCNFGGRFDNPEHFHSRSWLKLHLHRRSKPLHPSSWCQH